MRLESGAISTLYYLMINLDALCFAFLMYSSLPLPSSLQQRSEQVTLAREVTSLRSIDRVIFLVRFYFIGVRYLVTLLDLITKCHFVALGSNLYNVPIPVLAKI